MRRKKKFPIKVDREGEVALKEQVRKYISGEKERVTVTYALDMDLSIVPPLTVKDGHFLPTNNIVNSEEIRGDNVEIENLKRGYTSLFYGLLDSTYVCEHIIYKEGGEVTRNSIKLYIPLGVEKKEMICEEVTQTFPIQARGALSEKYFNFVMEGI